MRERSRKPYRPGCSRTGIIAIAIASSLLVSCAQPSASPQDSAKEIRIAELKGQRAGVAKEIELQNDAITDLQVRIDSGEDKIPGVRIIGKSADAVKQDKIRDRLIALQSDLARIDGEIAALSPPPPTAP